MMSAVYFYCIVNVLVESCERCFTTTTGLLVSNLLVFDFDFVVFHITILMNRENEEHLRSIVSFVGDGRVRVSFSELCRSRGGRYGTNKQRCQHEEECTHAELPSWTSSISSSATQHSSNIQLVLHSRQIYVIRASLEPFIEFFFYAKAKNLQKIISEVHKFFHTFTLDLESDKATTELRYQLTKPSHRGSSSCLTETTGSEEATGAWCVTNTKLGGSRERVWKPSTSSNAARRAQNTRTACLATHIARRAPGAEDKPLRCALR